ncbi:uncharacterized protein MYCFIDRAFT_180070 [Pseudocercospora fijiensis CIRAD86]|uniref:Uncharacterized protein n=1 Tax=Pseudocercospora fijiensis (strain CIRAD86) TaxID=383855 RepID=M3AJ34_PSEFD|nr:uncharacterized protein MYCFIDRAFT_180070 [Pseudocercospora fijiensis CIRAD86]EME77193.1 hypothetical protein MYCFIDRAFT_180070 [Pseudocercospora fijiensis CIRAD86]
MPNTHLSIGRDARLWINTNGRHICVYDPQPRDPPGSFMQRRDPPTGYTFTMALVVRGMRRPGSLDLAIPPGRRCYRVAQGPKRFQPREPSGGFMFAHTPQRRDTLTGYTFTIRKGSTSRSFDRRAATMSPEAQRSPALRRRDLELVPHSSWLLSCQESFILGIFLIATVVPKTPRTPGRERLQMAVIGLASTMGRGADALGTMSARLPLLYMLGQDLTHSMSPATLPDLRFLFPGRQVVLPEQKLMLVKSLVSWLKIWSPNSGTGLWTATSHPNTGSASYGIHLFMPHPRIVFHLPARILRACGRFYRLPTLPGERLRPFSILPFDRSAAPSIRRAATRAVSLPPRSRGIFFSTAPGWACLILKLSTNCFSVSEHTRLLQADSKVELKLKQEHKTGLLESQGHGACAMKSSRGQNAKVMQVQAAAPSPLRQHTLPIQSPSLGISHEAYRNPPRNSQIPKRKSNADNPLTKKKARVAKPTQNKPTLIAAWILAERSSCPTRPHKSPIRTKGQLHIEIQFGPSPESARVISLIYLVAECVGVLSMIAAFLEHEVANGYVQEKRPGQPFYSHFGFLDAMRPKFDLQCDYGARHQTASLAFHTRCQGHELPEGTMSTQKLPLPKCDQAHSFSRTSLRPNDTPPRSQLSWRAVGGDRCQYIGCVSCQQANSSEASLSISRRSSAGRQEKPGPGVLLGVLLAISLAIGAAVCVVGIMMNLRCLPLHDIPVSAAHRHVAERVSALTRRTIVSPEHHRPLSEMVPSFSLSPFQALAVWEHGKSHVGSSSITPPLSQSLVRTYQNACRLHARMHDHLYAAHWDCFHDSSHREAAGGQLSFPRSGTYVDGCVAFGMEKNEELEWPRSGSCFSVIAFRPCIFDRQCSMYIIAAPSFLEGRRAAGDGGYGIHGPKRTGNGTSLNGDLELNVWARQDRRRALTGATATTEMANLSHLSWLPGEPSGRPTLTHVLIFFGRYYDKDYVTCEERYEVTPTGLRSCQSCLGNWLMEGWTSYLNELRLQLSLLGLEHLLGLKVDAPIQESYRVLRLLVPMLNSKELRSTIINTSLMSSTRQTGTTLIIAHTNMHVQEGAADTCSLVDISRNVEMVQKDTLQLFILQAVKAPSVCENAPRCWRAAINKEMIYKLETSYPELIPIIELLDNLHEEDEDGGSLILVERQFMIPATCTNITLSGPLWAYPNKSTSTPS